MATSTVEVECVALLSAFLESSGIGRDPFFVLGLFDLSKHQIMVDNQAAANMAKMVLVEMELNKMISNII